MEQILPPPVAVAKSFGDLPDAKLFPEEKALIAGGPQAAARVRLRPGLRPPCAAQLDETPVPIPCGSRNAPRWPAGIAGASRSARDTVPPRPPGQRPRSSRSALTSSWIRRFPTGTGPDLAAPRNVSSSPRSPPPRRAPSPLAPAPLLSERGPSHPGRPQPGRSPPRLPPVRPSPVPGCHLLGPAAVLREGICVQGVVPADPGMATLRPGLRPEGVALRAVRLTGRARAGTFGAWRIGSWTGPGPGWTSRRSGPCSASRRGPITTASTARRRRRS